MNKAIFLDRDGTINVEKNYLYKIRDFEFLPGAVDGLRLLQGKGYLLIIITNQSGIGRGYYTEQDYLILNDWMCDELKTRGVRIDAVYFCPHLPDANIIRYRKDCDCRKPKPGLFEKATKEFNLDLSKCFAIGDKIRDCAICENTDCRGFLIGKNEDKTIIDAVKEGGIKNVRYALSLLDAARMITV